MSSEKLRVAMFGIAAWLVPPIVGELLGWKGIWGTGSAFADYAIPFPTTGGIFHLPSFGVCIALMLWRQSGQEPVASVARPLLAGMSIAGVLLLLDMNALFLSATTDVAAPSGAGLFSGNPLGLFLLSDGILTQFFLPSHERELGALGTWLGGAGAFALPPLLVSGMVTASLPASSQGRLMPGSTLQGPSRSDDIVTLYAPGALDPKLLEAELSKDLSVLPPQMHENAEDQAVLIFDSLDAARSMRLYEARLTWCRYEDGTPSKWMEGEGDCFSEHVSFSERWEQLYSTVEDGLSPEVRRYVTLRRACENVVLLPEANFSAVSEQKWCFGLERLKGEILARTDLTERDQSVLATDSDSLTNVRSDVPSDAGGPCPPLGKNTRNCNGTTYSTALGCGGADSCFDGFCCDRGAITCVQDTCPPGVGRNYTGHCKCEYPDTPVYDPCAQSMTACLAP